MTRLDPVKALRGFHSKLEFLQFPSNHSRAQRPIEIHSAVGKATLVRRRCPASAKRKANHRTKVKSEHGKQPGVVLVDDDNLVLSALRTLLEIEGGFQVWEFTDSLRAIEA